MQCRIIDTVRRGVGWGVWYRRTGVWMRCPGEEKQRGGVGPFIYTQRAWHPRSRGTIAIISSGVSNAAVRDIRNHPEGKHRLAKKPIIGEAAAWFGCIIATVARAVRGERGFPAQDAITRRTLSCPMQVIGD